MDKCRRHGLRTCVDCAATRGGLVQVIEADILDARGRLEVRTDDGVRRILSLGADGTWTTESAVLAVPADTSPRLDDGVTELLADEPGMADLRCVGTAYVRRALEWADRT